MGSYFLDNPRMLRREAPENELHSESTF